MNLVTKAVLDDLAGILGASSVTSDAEKCAVYSEDKTLPWHYGTFTAEAVCFPESTAQVSALLQYANERNIPVTPRGAGSGLSGGAVPFMGGIVLSMERMNNILEIDAENRTLTAEPGVITSEITKAAKQQGLFYAGDPCSGDISSIGGNVAENAGGNKVIKYGATGAHVLGLEVVLADGSVLMLGGKRRKDVTGYDLIHLIVGSEGTLAVVTKIILNLLPLPTCVTDLLVPMPSVDSAMRLVAAVSTRGGVIPSSVEFMDRKSIKNVEAHTGMKIPHSDAAAFLIIQMDGMDRRQLWLDVEKVGDICVDMGALEVFVAEDSNARDRVWKIRRLVGEEEWTSSMDLLSKEDVVIPSGRIARFFEELPTLAASHNAIYNAFGHVADGNIHLTLFPAASGMESGELKKMGEAMCGELYTLVKSLGGTLSGEHGIGMKRRNYTSIFLNDAHVALLKRIKLAFDPNGILNPGKIVV